MVIAMKEVERKVISELMKNSRRSDREIAKAIGTSQPTVSRLIKKLKAEGYIKEFTMIPNFSKLGYHLLALTFVRLKGELSAEEIEKIRQMGMKMPEETSLETIMAERGLGFRCDGVIMSFHEDFSSFQDFKKWLKSYGFIDTSACDSFVINLGDEIRYRPLTLRTLAKHLLTTKEKETKS
jgi:DNA-binding Lrp family transcriptional regulator